MLKLLNIWLCSMLRLLSKLDLWVGVDSTCKKGDLLFDALKLVWVKWFEGDDGDFKVGDECDKLIDVWWVRLCFFVSFCLCSS